MLRSFIVYFIFVAGLVLASPQNPFSEATQDQYFRFAWYRSSDFWLANLWLAMVRRFSIASFANSLGFASSNRNRLPSKWTGHQQHDHD